MIVVFFGHRKKLTSHGEAKLDVGIGGQLTGDITALNGQLTRGTEDKHTCLAKQSSINISWWIQNNGILVARALVETEDAQEWEA